MNISNLFGWYILCSYSYICHNTLRILRLDMWHPTSVQEVEKYRVRLCSRTDPQASWHSQPTFRGTGDPHRICAERDAWIWRAAGGVFFSEVRTQGPLLRSVVGLQGQTYSDLIWATLRWDYPWFFLKDMLLYIPCLTHQQTVIHTGIQLYTCS